LKVRIALVQLNTTEREEVLEKVKEAVRDVRADIYVLPELLTTGYKDPGGKAEGFSGRTLAFFMGTAKETGAAFVFSFARRDEDGSVRNTAVVVDKSGDIVAYYDKVHLFLPLGEGEIFTPGDRIEAFSFGGVKVGLQICYDLRFPEAFRKLALSGASIVFVPAQWPAVRVEVWNSLLVARASENGIFVVGSNRVGEEKGITYGGNSAVVSPSGEVLLRLGRREAVGAVDIDTDEILRVREKINVLRDRRPGVY